MASRLQQVLALVQSAVDTERNTASLPAVIWDFGNRELAKPKTNERVCWVRDTDKFNVNHQGETDFVAGYSVETGVVGWLFAPTDEAAELLRDQVVKALQSTLGASLLMEGARWELPDWLTYGETCQLYFSLGQPIGDTEEAVETLNVELEDSAVFGDKTLQYKET